MFLFFFESMLCRSRCSSLSIVGISLLTRGAICSPNINVIKTVAIFLTVERQKVSILLEISHQTIQASRVDEFVQAIVTKTEKINTFQTAKRNS